MTFEELEARVRELERETEARLRKERRRVEDLEALVAKMGHRITRLERGEGR